MAKITLEQISTECARRKWKCNSTAYVNLQTPMEFRCPEGHLIQLPWSRVRDKFHCPTCASNAKKKISHISSKRKENEAYRILALDQSSHKTGFAIYDNQNLISYGVFETNSSDPYERILNLADWLESMIVAWKPDEIGIEETQYQPGSGDGHNVFKLLSEVMGACILVTLRNKIKINTVLIATWRHHCGVRGNKRPDQKRSAQLLVKKWHDVTVTDDESDAICIGKYFADKHAADLSVIGSFE